MASLSRAILTRIQTLLRAVNGAGGFTYNLSDSDDRVLLMAPTSPEGPPRVYLTDFTIGSEYSHQLGGYDRRGIVQFTGYVGTSEDNPEERLLAATDLLDDICQALEADRTLQDRVYNMIVQAQVIDGNEAGFQNLGMVEGTIEVQWIANNGVGV